MRSTALKQYHPLSESRNLALQLLRSPFKWLFYSNLANSIGVELRLMAQSWLILELGGSHRQVRAVIASGRQRVDDRGPAASGGVANR